MITILWLLALLALAAITAFALADPTVADRGEEVRKYFVMAVPAIIAIFVVFLTVGTMQKKPWAGYCPAVNQETVANGL